jgi:DNA end-binding protein Ku
MAARSIAALSISFGLVSIPVKVFSATESKSSVSFNLLHKSCGSRLKQQYLCLRENIPVERADMVKGYEFEKDKYVIFEPDELSALEATASHTIDIVSFMPSGAIDPIYFDKAYYLGPDRRGAKPYNLLARAMRDTGTCALAKWVWKGKQSMVQIRAVDEGLVLQQLLYADEVRSIQEAGLEQVEVQPAELALAQQIIEQNSVEGYDPTDYTDEEKQRVLAAIDQKIAGHKITVTEAPQHAGGEVIDLMEALRASLQSRRGTLAPAVSPRKPAVAKEEPPKKERKSPRRAAGAAAPTPAKRAGSRK